MWDSGTNGIKPIKHNNKLSHQTVPLSGRAGQKSKSYAFTRDPAWSVHDPRPHRSTAFTPEGVTLTFFLGHWDMGQKWDGSGRHAETYRPPDFTWLIHRTPDAHNVRAAAKTGIFISYA